MKIFKGLDSFSSLENTIVTNGTFDGVHMGHKKVLSTIVSKAKEENLKSVVITFWPHPRLVLNPNSSFQLITTINERISLLKKTGIDNLIIIPFSKEFSELSAKGYIDDILIKKLDIKNFIIGHDHRFGKNREGDFNYLQQYGLKNGFTVSDIPQKSIDENAISSTNIREAILSGDIILANTLLGYQYFLTGTVIQGKKIGRKLGFPTANIGNLAQYKLIPPSGVYAVNAKLKDRSYMGMLNIGTRPTVDDSEVRSIEVHLFDFDEEIYDSEISIDFFDKIRDEQKFNSLEELKNQLTLDKESTIKLFKSSKP